MHLSTRLFVVASVVIPALAFAAGLLSAEDQRPASPEREWRMHGGDAGHTQHSPLAAIDTTNVRAPARSPGPTTRVTRAPRTARRSSATRSWSTACCTPPRPDCTRSHSTPRRAASCGASIPSPLAPAPARSASTAVSSSGATAASGASSTAPARRCSRSTPLPARLVPGFGREGRVDLGEGLGRDLAGAYVRATTPGVVYRDLLILGSAVGEGPGPSAPGHVRAFDVRTGAVRWTFRTIPQPGEYGYDTWPPDAWKTAGGANSWSGLSLDPARGLVFVPTGSPAFDFWGGDRKGANLFGNSLVALRAATGERVWHYQLVHHDLWDRDLPQAPVLARRAAGRPHDRRGRAGDQVRARVRVRPRERRAALRGRGASGPGLGPPGRGDLPGRSRCRGSRRPSRARPSARPTRPTSRPPRTPPSSSGCARCAAPASSCRRAREGTVIFPGFDGGAEWGGSAFDPQTRLLYVNANEMPWILEMREVPKAGALPTGRARLRAALRRVPRRVTPGRSPGPVPVARRARDASGAGRHARDRREGQGRHARLRVPVARRARRGRILRARRARARRPRRERRPARGGPTRTSATTASSTPRATRR